MEIGGEIPGLLIILAWNVALCVTFWNVIGKIAHGTPTSRTKSFLMLSCAFVLLNILSIFLADDIFGSSHGKFNLDTGAILLIFVGTFLLSPIMIVVGVVRMSSIKAKRDTANQAL